MGTEAGFQKPSPILKYFDTSHLKDEKLIAISGSCKQLAYEMDTVLPMNAETSAGLRKLLEAKDCFVRAALNK